jgi:hypothetical protein
MKKLVSRALIVIVALGLLLALIVFGVNAARKLARSEPGQGTLPPPPLHGAIGNSDTSTLEALPEEDAHADAIGSAERNRNRAVRRGNNACGMTFRPARSADRGDCCNVQSAYHLGY